MKYYVQRGYVPEDIEGSGMHKDGAAMTLEYAYQDWCLAQFALALGKTDDATWLTQRSFNYTNLWDASVKFMRPRLKDGSWWPAFAPVGQQGSFATKGFCEANSAIYTHFVPQDMAGLIRLFGGAEPHLPDHLAGLQPRDDPAQPALFPRQDLYHYHAEQFRGEWLHSIRKAQRPATEPILVSAHRSGGGRRAGTRTGPATQSLGRWLRTAPIDPPQMHSHSQHHNRMWL